MLKNKFLSFAPILLVLTTLAPQAHAERAVENCADKLEGRYFETNYARWNDLSLTKYELHVEFTQEPNGMRIYIDRGKNRMVTLDSDNLQVTKEIFWPTVLTIGGSISSEMCVGHPEKCDVSDLRAEIDYATKYRNPVEDPVAEAHIKKGLSCAARMISNFAARVHDSAHQQMIEVNSH